MQRSLKNYSPDIYGKALGRLDFPNSYNFEKNKDASFSFIQNVMVFIDLVAPIKSRRRKRNSQECFNGEVQEK